MKVKTKAEAWKKANELFPTDYMKDDVLSKRAGYPQYYSTSPEHSDDHINDLNVRLEVVVGGKMHKHLDRRDGRSSAGEGSHESKPVQRHL